VTIGARYNLRLYTWHCHGLAQALILKLEQDRDNLMTVAIEEIYDLEKKLAAYKAAVGTVAEAKLLKEQVQRRNETKAAVPEVWHFSPPQYAQNNIFGCKPIHSELCMAFFLQ
jgi:hypothetical protein